METQSTPSLLKLYYLYSCLLVPKQTCVAMATPMPYGCVIALVMSFPFVVSLGGSPSSTLKHVNLLYRHGDRSPNIIFPNDVNQLDVWPDGLGWLTNLGIQQQYELGQYLRQRYGGLINVTRYDHRQISIESSDKPRCVMSLQANLAGMFTAQGDQVWSDVIPTWQPIPFTMVPRNLDNKVAIHADCPRYNQLYHDMFQSPVAMEFQEKNQAFFDMLSNHTGWTEKSTVTTTWQIIDPVVSERAHNMTLNPWLEEPGVLDKLTEIQHFTWELLYKSPEMARLKGGPLLKEMIDNMKSASKGSSGDLKVHMYSGHDSTVSALLHAMTVSNGMQPPYRSLIMMELHTVDHQDVVKVFYRNDTNTDPLYLLPNGCEDPCKLSTFQKLMEPRLPQDWNKECKVANASPPRQLYPAALMSLPLLLAVFRMMTSLGGGI